MTHQALDSERTFRITPRGAYSLEASARFLCGFTPAAGASVKLDDGRLVLGFLDEKRHVPVTVALGQATVDGVVAGEISGAASREETATITRQVARLLSLDHDGRGLAEIGGHDAVVARLLAAAPGFRPVCFPSPYEAAVWGVLAQRIAMPVAAAIKQRLAAATGTLAGGFGRTFHPAPAPERLLALDSFQGVSAEKMSRLHAVALAALDGKLDAERLRALPLARAVEELRAIRGVGPWTAEHIVLRGCGAIDELPTKEPRVLRGLAEAYALDATPTAEEALVIAERWRPYRMWVAVLVVMGLRGSTGWTRHASRRAIDRLHDREVAGSNTRERDRSKSTRARDPNGTVTPTMGRAWGWPSARHRNRSSPCVHSRSASRRVRSCRSPPASYRSLP